VATDDDIKDFAELKEKENEALAVFKELVESYGLEMKPIGVQFILGSNKATFYFSSEGRIDFRDLVKDLASKLHVFVDMRQLGVRDEARLIGGLGRCGDMLCCLRMNCEFEPVSIRMAKEQDLPLNPAKVSGACGRLMCCLRYEMEAYKDFKSRAPKINSRVKTPLGDATVVELDTPLELVRIKLDGDKTISVPLARLDLKYYSEEEMSGKKGSTVKSATLADADFYSFYSPPLELNIDSYEIEIDLNVESKSKKKSSRGESQDSQEQKKQGRRRRRRQGQGQADGAAQGASGETKGDKGASDRGDRGAKGPKGDKGGKGANRKKLRLKNKEKPSSNNQEKAESNDQEKRKPRPGQHSSAQKKANADTRKQSPRPFRSDSKKTEKSKADGKNSATAKPKATNQGGEKPEGARSDNTRRRRRRRENQ
jgi:cell fate regulator YaaT (PSP1 superfamily)